MMNSVTRFPPERKQDSNIFNSEFTIGMTHFEQKKFDNHVVDADSIIDVEKNEERDPFLGFIDYARSVLVPEEVCDSNESRGETSGPGWSWIASRILKTCIAYSSGVTSAILLSELSQAWSEQHRAGGPRKRPECISHLKKKHKRKKLPNAVSIDSIYEKRFLSLSSVLEAVILDAFLLPGTNIHVLSLGDVWSCNTIDLYLHRRYYDLVDTDNGILKRGREILLTGCYLRTTSEGSGCPRLLPTEYLVILLDEDQDDDAMLLGAQFCSDSFSSISLDAVSNGESYSLYARIESIGSLESQRKFGNIQRQQLTLVDNDGVKLQFLLWGEQVLLANLLSAGSMLALDRPFVASAIDSDMETCGELCLEYGSATQVYLVPFIQQEEQVSISLTPNRYQGSRLQSAFDPSQGPQVSQVTLPCDSEGSIDFSNYPFQSFVIDLHDKMTSISLYGTVTDIFRERNTAETIFFLRIEDKTGAVWAKLHFSRSWSLGRLSLGHTVYISGLTCSKSRKKLNGLFYLDSLEVSWFGNGSGSSFVNLSCLPALLNSSCLHQLSYLSDLSIQSSRTHICRVWVDRIEQCHVNTKFLHAVCGHIANETPSGGFKCNFCRCNFDAEPMRAFHLKITIADESTKVFAWCTGQTATELLQISPDEFNDLSEEEQVMYPASLESERFMVAIVSCQRQGYEVNEDLISENEGLSWEITRALKCD